MPVRTRIYADGRKRFEVRWIDAAAELTAREREVLELIARGMPNKAIALRLSLAEKTVKAHVSAILRKLDVTDRTQAALKAVREHLVDLDAG
ncbi:MAG TPA: response regulator transcription factor [Gaiellales bacterium]|nr:response regulator transcription factor [Gaiellales bacterium]